MVIKIIIMIIIITNNLIKKMNPIKIINLRVKVVIQTLLMARKVIITQLVIKRLILFLKITMMQFNWELLKGLLKFHNVIDLINKCI